MAPEKGRRSIGERGRGVTLHYGREDSTSDDFSTGLRAQVCVYLSLTFCACVCACLLSLPCVVVVFYLASALLFSPFKTRRAFYSLPLFPQDEIKAFTPPSWWRGGGGGGSGNSGGGGGGSGEKQTVAVDMAPAADKEYDGNAEANDALLQLQQQRQQWALLAGFQSA